MSSKQDNIQLNMLLSKQHKQISDQINGSSIKLKAIMQSLNNITTFLQKPHPNQCTAIFFASSAQKKILDTINNTKHSISDQLDQTRKSLEHLTTLNSSELDKQSNKIIHSLQKHLQKSPTKHNYQNQINAKILPKTQKFEENLLNKLPDIIGDALHRYCDDEGIEAALSQINGQIIKLRMDQNNKNKNKSDTDDERIIRFEKRFRKEMDGILDELKCIKQIGTKNVAISTSLQTEIEQMNECEEESKATSSADETLPTNVFLNRMNSMEQRFYSMFEQQRNFQKCILEQLKQLNANSNQIEVSESPYDSPTMSITKHKKKKKSELGDELWITLQQIHKNVTELNQKMDVLKEQQINAFDKMIECNKSRNNSREYVQPVVRRVVTVRQNTMSKESSSAHMDDDCHDLVTWNKMIDAEKKTYCMDLMKRLFAKELNEKSVQPKNSFYLQFATKIIKDWKERKLWNETDWEAMDERKLVIRKIWDYMLLNWNDCVA